ncbi:sensor histidine kinase [Minwuia thermotolerans]|uniref:histidine kinase n=2 Tax=Minwuia thermotolerans TaxID=2056226 RepID=A0A2M9G235_9PROT|nr:HAMP domain-containing sensor histidine kinase [Minwuia thermotolerans]PJK29734.1 hypothetical protein CVT23_11895 [Minwuia thermotolerans]
MHKQFNESRLLAAAGHDLRQPLQAMQLFASTLSASPMEMCREIGRNIECSARELGYMFDVLFDMSKLETGAIEPEIVSTPLAAVVGQVLDEIGPALTDRGVALRAELPEVCAFTDGALLGRMLHHLLQNVAVHAPSGDAVVRAGIENGRLTLCVEDDGPGIPAAMRQAVFEPFMQAPQEGERPQGLGLGLTVVRRLADLLGHEVVLGSGPGRGAQVRVILGADEAMARSPGELLSAPTSQ